MLRAMPTPAQSSQLLSWGLSLGLSEFEVLLPEFHPEMRVRVRVEVGYGEKVPWWVAGRGPARGYKPTGDNGGQLGHWGLGGSFGVCP